MRKNEEFPNTLAPLAGRELCSTEKLQGAPERLLHKKLFQKTKKPLLIGYRCFKSVGK